MKRLRKMPIKMMKEPESDSKEGTVLLSGDDSL